MTSLNRIFFVIGLFFCLTNCTAPVEVVETEAADDFSLAAYETYSFFELNESGDTVLQGYQPELDMIKMAISYQMDQYGLKRSDEPELLVNIGAVVVEKVQTRETHIREAPIYIGQRRYSWQSEEVPVRRYQEGTVTVHLVDKEENRLVWRGVAEGMVPENEERLQEAIATGAEELFNEIPTD